MPVHFRGSYPAMVIYLIAEYLATAAYHSGVPLFYRARGFDLGQISLLLGIPPLVAVLAQPVWGALADRCRCKNRVHRLLLIGAAACLPLYAWPQGVPGMALVVAAYACFGTALPPMTETILLEQLDAWGRGFGGLRVWGTVAYGLGSLAVGAVLQRWAEGFVWLTAGLMATAAGAAWALPQVAGRARTQAGGRWRDLLRDRDLLFLLLLAAVLQMTQGLYFAFFPSYFTDSLGGSKTLYGAAMLLATLSEAPFLLLGDKLLARFGAGKLLLCSGASMAAHWLLLGLSGTVAAAFATQALSALGYIVPAFCLAKYVQRTVPEALRARGQMFAALVGFALARSAAGLLGRLLAARFSTQPPVFFIMAALAGGATVALAARLSKVPVQAAKGE